MYVDVPSITERANIANIVNYMCQSHVYFTMTSALSHRQQQLSEIGGNEDAQ